MPPRRGPGSDAAEANEVTFRPRHRRHQVGHVKLHHLLAGPVPGVGHRHPDADRGRGVARLDGDVGVTERRVPEPMPETEERGVLAIGVVAVKLRERSPRNDGCCGGAPGP